jgi:cytosine/adenosine deaminase-related metal-dependent hydrolase
MDATARRYALSARYLFPVDARPVADASLIVSDGRIERIVLEQPDCPTHDLGNAAILPGLVNAHAHLEFSDLDVPLGMPGMTLPDWIRLVLDYRIATDDRAGQAQRVANGVAEAVSHGTTTLGEIATIDWSFPTADRIPIQLVVFREAIGMAVAGIEDLLQQARDHVEVGQKRGHWLPGISPHAPYTVHPQLLMRLVEYSRAARIPIAIHLAESNEEIQWLRDGSGPFAALLAERGGETVFRQPDATRPWDILRTVAEAHRTLVVHGNYLRDDEIGFLGTHAQGMSAVYCPRTHAYFRHSPYPLAQLVEAGANVALGTDGRGSNPDLSVLAEMRYLAATFPQIPLDQVVKMGTSQGARALGLAERCGTLTPGKEANLAIVRLPNDRADDPHELLLHYEEPVLATVFRGGVVYPTTGRLPMTK